MLTLDVGGDEKELIMEQLAYNPQVSYMQAAWDNLVVTERMIADINSCKYSGEKSFLDIQAPRILALRPANFQICLLLSIITQTCICNIQRFLGCKNDSF